MASYRSQAEKDSEKKKSAEQIRQKDRFPFPMLIPTYVPPDAAHEPVMAYPSSIPRMTGSKIAKWSGAYVIGRLSATVRQGPPMSIGHCDGSSEAEILAERKRVLASQRSRGSTSESKQKEKRQVEPVKLEIQSTNHFASAYNMRMKAGHFGSGKLELRASAISDGAIEIARVSDRLSAAGAREGDVLISVDHIAVPAHADPQELVALMASEAKDHGRGVLLGFWRWIEDASLPTDYITMEHTFKAGDDGESAEWGYLSKSPLSSINGYFLAAAVGEHHEDAGELQIGDLLVGVNHRPMPANVSTRTALEFIESRYAERRAQSKTTVTLLLARLSQADTRYWLLSEASRIRSEREKERKKVRKAMVAQPSFRVVDAALTRHRSSRNSPPSMFSFCCSCAGEEEQKPRKRGAEKTSKNFGDVISKIH